MQVHSISSHHLYENYAKHVTESRPYTSDDDGFGGLVAVARVRNMSTCISQNSFNVVVATCSFKASFYKFLNFSTGSIFVFFFWQSQSVLRFDSGSPFWLPLGTDPIYRQTRVTALSYCATAII